MVDAVKRDPRAAPVTEKMKALLAIAAKVQQGRPERDERLTRS